MWCSTFRFSLVWLLAVFISTIDDMQTPFGGGTLDMPGLSYVCAAAELSLRIVRGGGQPNEITDVPQPANLTLFRLFNGRRADTKLEAKMRDAKARDEAEAVLDEDDKEAKADREEEDAEDG